MMKNKSFIICFISTFLFMTSSFSMMRDLTELLVRAQDDVTLGGLKIKIAIPEPIEDGPKNRNIEVITEEHEKAVVDNNGNFLNYRVDKKGHIAPRIILNSFLEQKWPPKKANVSICKGRKKEKKTLNVEQIQDDEKYSYIEIDKNFTSQNFKKNILNQLPNVPISLKTEDARGRKLFTKSVDKMPFFDAVSVFGTVWSVFDMYEKDLNSIYSIDPIDSIGVTEAKKRFANFRKTESIRVFPYMKEEEFKTLYPSDDYKEYEANAFYDYRENDPAGKHVLLFFPVVLGGSEYTSQSSDVVSHEAGHAVLNILRPDLWNLGSREINAFHETFGDMTALSIVLSFPELRQKILEKTKGNLHIDSFLSIIGEKIVDRDVSECTTLSIVPSCEEHDLSERLTKALYGTLADVFNIKRINLDEEQHSTFLESTASEFRRLFLKTTIETNFQTFSEFGRAIRERSMDLTDNTLYIILLHTNFLRQGIDLTDLFNSPMICIVPKKDGYEKDEKDQLKPIRCSTNQRKITFWGNNSTKNLKKDYLSMYMSNVSISTSSKKEYGGK